MFRFLQISSMVFDGHSGQAGFSAMLTNPSSVHVRHANRIRALSQRAAMAGQAIGRRRQTNPMNERPIDPGTTCEALIRKPIATVLIHIFSRRDGLRKARNNPAQMSEK